MSNAMKTLLDSAGRIRWPDSVQARLGVKPGDELAWEEEPGRWFIKPGAAPDTPHELVTPQPVSDDDLNWQELSYDPVPLKRAGQVAVRIAHREKRQPTVPASDEELPTAHQSGVVHPRRSSRERRRWHFVPEMMAGTQPS